MSKREKLRAKLRNNPSDATMQDVATLLGRYGFILERIQGSHHIFRYSDGNQTLNIVIPMFGRQVKTIYVKRVIELLDRLFPIDKIESNDDE